MSLPMRVQSSKRLPPNRAGRDWVVGDLHGHRELLERELERVGFDPSRDRVLSVGDLVDRGPDSLVTLSLIQEPWFHAVLGNHEIRLLQHFQRFGGAFRARKGSTNGPEAWLVEAAARHPRRVERLRHALLSLPVVLEVADDAMSYRVAHADIVATSCGARRLKAAPTVPIHEAEELTTSRAIVLGLQRGSLTELEFGGRAVHLGEGLTCMQPLTYVGHSPLPEVTVHGGCVFIDQGVGSGRRAGSRPPTLLEHSAFAYWLSGVTHARGLAGPGPLSFGQAPTSRAPARSAVTAEPELA